MRRFPGFLLASLIAAVRLPSSASSAPSQPLPWAQPAVDAVTVPGLPPVTSHIAIDQFGYLPDEAKTAVISDPRKGYNAGQTYRPGPELQLRRASDGAVVSRGPAQEYDHGAVDRASGDRGWWFDFSPVREPGDYYVFDPANGRRSHVFHIGADVYARVLQAAARVFYYQREALAHHAPFAEAPWRDEATYLQDRHARAITAPNDVSTERDLSGGWMDAGDTNKYPTFLPEVIHPLLYAWRANPSVFSDDTNIPESGNGRPDLLDEIKWELDWLVKMQDADGGVLLKMGHDTYAGAKWPPSADKRPRYYGPKVSSSTLATAGVLAHAARVYGEFPEWRAFAADLRDRAERAWQWYRSHPRTYDADHGEIKSGDADKNAAEHDRWEAVACFHLWVLTGRAEYHDVFRRQYHALRQFTDPVWSPYEVGQAECLIDYLAQPGADARIVRRIQDRLRTSTHRQRFLPQNDTSSLYRDWMVPTSFHWGNNQVRAGYGIAALQALSQTTDASDRNRLRQRALDLLHSFHGVNPLGLVYLSNMEQYGAEVSVMRVYHDWFNAGSPLAANPPPGYVTGGPNHSYGGTIVWLKQQPDEKCYADFNLGYPEQSWELSEPAIYYQAMYIRLLAPFVGSPSPAAH